MSTEPNEKDTGPFESAPVAGTQTTMAGHVVRTGPSTLSGTQPGPAPAAEADPRYTLIIVGDDGKMYKLIKEVWQQHPMDQPVALGLAEQLKQFGTYLAYIPPDLAVGVGSFCTLINLDAILRNNPAPPPQAPDNP